ncbi:uncharacterized protein [Procambarus clarkii]|uniref:uncharacterized protein n=1 Tax=Procambarus clarkii TaxID=6728 RepID=UPI001E678789|nr:uncharacterized protein LOC123768656 [Procambarus clarkii]
MVSHTQGSVVVLLLVVTGVLAALEDLAGCKKPCVNRFGRKLCCDSVARNEPPRCPPMPRILVDCNNSAIIEDPVTIKLCKNDSDCKKNEMCCEDICNFRQLICMPSKVNTHYLFP